MKKPTILYAGVVLGAVLAGQAAAQLQAHQHRGAPASAAAAASTKEFRAADSAMMRAMDVPYTGDADIDFRLHMIPHHEGAIAMAKVALAHATDADTKTLAQQIIDDQTREIAAMRDWLKAHGK